MVQKQPFFVIYLRTCPVEVCPFRQYKVKVHGSGRYTIRNRIHLKPLLVFRPTTTLQKPPPAGTPSLPPTAPPTAPNSRADPTSDSASSTGPSSYASAQSSSYAPSSADYAHQSTDRSRSPLIQRRSTRERNEPDRYGEWTRWLVGWLALVLWSLVCQRRPVVVYLVCMWW